MTTKVCAWGKCDREFEPHRHNQIYCSGDHANRAAKESILRRYHERKAMKQGKARRCKCGVPLSRYNYTKRCSRCEALEASKVPTKSERESVFERMREHNEQ